MRSAFTLIELIITIVIMAGIFAVIPKILFATNRSDTFAMKQDAMLEAVSLVNIASRLAWDENNSDRLDILQTDSANTALTCDPAQRFRQGSYLSANGRMCTENITATYPPAAESGEDSYQLFDDIDDFNGVDINVTAKGKRKYLLKNRVAYLDDTIINETGQKLTIDLSQAAEAAASTNIKRFTSTVKYVGKRGRERNIASFYYYSTNIGQISLAYRNW